LFLPTDVLVLAYLPAADAPHLAAFSAAAEALRADMDWRYVTDRALVNGECGTDCASPFVVMHKRGEKDAPRYEGELSADLLKTWAQAKALPLVIRFGSPTGMKHLQKAFSSSLPRLVAVVKRESEEVSEQLQQASAASDDLTVILAVEADSKRLLDYYGGWAARGSGGRAWDRCPLAHDIQGCLTTLMPPSHACCQAG
jgi:hypothetical protein